MRLTARQRFLGPRTFFVCVLLVDLLQIMSLDMYIPALPSMQVSFGVSAAYLNQTIFAYLMLSSLAMLLSGTISDRLGRKPVLVFAAVLFTLSSVGCAFAPGINLLILFRVGQAIGYGITSTIAPALLKDAYDDESAKVAISLMQSLVIIGPVLAPFLGSMMLTLTDWRGIFVFLTACGALTLVLALLITETLPRHARKSDTLGASLLGMAKDAGGLVRKPGFSTLAAYMAVSGVPFFAFIAASSYIVLVEFGMGYLEYSLVYGTACLINMAAPYVYLALSKRLKMSQIAQLTTGLVCTSTALMLLFAGFGPAPLLLAFAPYALAEGIVRPAAYVELLDQPPALVGTASALSSFAYGAITALATVAATLPWPTFLFGLDAVSVGTSVMLLLLAGCFARTWNLKR